MSDHDTQPEPIEAAAASHPTPVRTEVERITSLEGAVAGLRADVGVIQHGQEEILSMVRTQGQHLTKLVRLQDESNALTLKQLDSAMKQLESSEHLRSDFGKASRLLVRAARSPRFAAYVLCGAAFYGFVAAMIARLFQ